jgi:hypothetical protein
LRGAKKYPEALGFGATAKERKRERERKTKGGKRKNKI